MSKIAIADAVAEIKDRLVVGFCLTPRLWFGSNDKNESATALAFFDDYFTEGVGVGIQNQGLVLAAIETSTIPSYRESSAQNLLTSETVAFVLGFFNAFAFAFYEAQKKYHGGGGIIPRQEVTLSDLFLWTHKTNASVEIVNQIQPSPVFTPSFLPFEEEGSRLKITVGEILNIDLAFRPEISPDVFTATYFDKQIIGPEMYRRFALLNRGVYSITNAEFDTALVSTWTVIELTMKDAWARLLTQKDISRKRREYLTGRDFKAAIVAETLNLHGVISNELLGKITRARNARNRLMHDSKITNARVCGESYEAASELIQIHHGIELMYKAPFYMGDVKFPQP